MKHETSITYSAPAKVILSGEHAVVYGKPAIAVALDRRLTFTISLSNQSTKDDKITAIAKTVKNYLTNPKYQILNPSTSLRTSSQYSYQIESNIPIGRGLGSSGALCAASCAAFYEYYSGKKINEKDLNILAHKAEKIFHKNPSGIDTTVSVLGGLLFYRKEFDFLKSIFKLPYHIPKKFENNILLIDSGKPAESTAEMVGIIVRNNYSKNPKRFQRIFNDMETITKQMTIAIVSENENLLVQSIAKNEIYLEQIGVISNSTKLLITNLTKWGIGKVTGAGGISTGSGFILFYCQDKNAVINYCQKNKINYLEFKQANSGVTVIASRTK